MKNIITKNRLKLNLTMKELSCKVGVSEATISRWESGNIANMKQNHIIKLADALQISPLELLGIRNVTDDYNINGDDNLLSKYHKLNNRGKSKVINFTEELLKRNEYTTLKEHTELYEVKTIEKVSAGRGYSYMNNETSTYYTDRDNLKPYDFATVVSGDSMIPKYNDGDVVLVKQGYDSINGEIYVIDYNGESYIKKVYNDGDRFRLVSINRNYDNIIIDIPIDDSNYFNIVGKVVDSFTPIEKN